MEYIQHAYTQTYPEQGQMPLCGEFSLFENVLGLIVLGDPGMCKTRCFEAEATEKKAMCM